MVMLTSKTPNAIPDHRMIAWPPGRHVVVSTSTASGKSMCYNIPVIEALAQDPGASAVYVFPTKALAQDQLRALRELLEDAFPGRAPVAAVYDGDTPQVSLPPPLPQALRGIRSSFPERMSSADGSHIEMPELPYHRQLMQGVFDSSSPLVVNLRLTQAKRMLGGCEQAGYTCGTASDLHLQS